MRWTSLEARERDILAAVLRIVRVHPKVGFAWRANAGAMELNGRTVRFGFTGQADIVGVLKGGRFFALEVKSASGRLTRHQSAFLDNVRAVGGVAGVVRSVEEAKFILDTSKAD